MKKPSAAQTDCLVPDPTDKAADGNFGSAGTSHRGGYAEDKLAHVEYWARKGGTLNAGEGLILCEEIDRLREQLRDTHTKVFHLEEKLTWVERERDQLTSLPAERILAALREPSEAVRKAAFMEEQKMYDPKATLKQKSEITALTILAAAVAAAEEEVANDAG